MTTQEIQIEAKEFIGSPVDLRIIIAIVSKFRDEFGGPFVLNETLFPDSIEAIENPMMFMSFYTETNVQIQHQGGVTKFNGLVPIDIYNYQESMSHFIALLRHLDDKLLNQEIHNFIDGNPHYLAAANITHALSDESNPTIVLVNNEQDNPNRTLTFTRTNNVLNFVKQYFDKSSSLNSKITLDSQHVSERKIPIHFSNKEWRGGSVQKHKNPSVFIDPVYSVNIPLFKDGHKFILQIGLKKPPSQIDEVKFFDELEKIRVESQKMLDEVWDYTEKSLPRVTKEERKQIELPIVRDLLTLGEGYMEAALRLLARKGLTEETLQLLINFLNEGLKAMNNQKRLAENVFNLKIEASAEANQAVEDSLRKLEAAEEAKKEGVKLPTKSGTIFE